MNNKPHKIVDKELFTRHYPTTNSNDKRAKEEKKNSATMLYGKRFYKDQTPVEYLAEMLLVFVSHKGQELAETDESSSCFSFKLPDNESPLYWPEDRIALKLFTFFPTSKLETRHRIHQETYIKALESIKDNIIGSTVQKDETIRLLQSLFSGFIGVSGNRTWVTQNFLPASTSLISREVMWEHTNALRKSDEITNWSESEKYFAKDKHNFMARGGELLFLQLSHLFSEDNAVLKRLLQDSYNSYSHLKGVELSQLEQSIDLNLKGILSNSLGQIDLLSHFIDRSLKDIRLKKTKATLGWVPMASEMETFLFAVEINNILNAALSDLEKLELLQLLCTLHVLRSLCFQAQRVDTSESAIDGFAGNYAWIVSDINSVAGNSVRKLAQNSFNSIESLLFRVLRIVDDNTDGQDEFKQSDPHGLGIFRKIAKEIGIVVPRTGGSQRFALPPLFLRLLVSSLLKPGERVTLTNFYQRSFSHFGIALGPKELAKAVKWGEIGMDVEDFSVHADCKWIEESLKQGGFLEELSDAVSIVVNPCNKEHS